ERLAADAVVLAVPHEEAADLLPAGSGIEPADLRALGLSPILNLHVIYDRTVMPFAFVAAVGSPVQFVFDRTRGGGLAHGQYVAVSLSAADEFIGQETERLRHVFVPELARLL